MIFSVQLFGLIAMFPIVFILEMSHKPGSSPEGNSPSGIIKNEEKRIIQLSQNGNDQMLNEAFPITLMPILLKNAY